MPKKKAPKTDSREFAQAMARAIINRDRFHNLPKLKPGQARWQHERAIQASIEFEDVADDATWVEFWTRENVVADIEAGDVAGVFGWLTSKIWWFDFKKRQKDAKRKAKKAN